MAGTPEFISYRDVVEVLRLSWDDDVFVEELRSMDTEFIWFLLRGPARGAAALEALRLEGAVGTESVSAPRLSLSLSLSYHRSGWRCRQEERPLLTLHDVGSALGTESVTTPKRRFLFVGKVVDSVGRKKGIC